jgi:hypothetical protein
MCFFVFPLLLYHTALSSLAHVERAVLVLSDPSHTFPTHTTPPCVDVVTAPNRATRILTNYPSSKSSYPESVRAWSFSRFCRLIRPYTVQHHNLTRRVASYDATIASVIAYDLLNNHNACPAYPIALYCTAKVTMAVCGCDPLPCGSHGNVTFTAALAKRPQPILAAVCLLHLAPPPSFLASGWSSCTRSDFG